MKLTIIDNPRPLHYEHYNDVANAPLSASLNCGYAYSIAIDKFWSVSYLNYSNSNKSIQIIAEEILNKNSDLILIHWVYSWGNENITSNILSKIKKSNPNIKIGAFGLFPTLAYKKLYSFSKNLDFIIVGEFEETLKKLLSKLKKNEDFSNINGLYIGLKDFKRNDCINDLSTLPIPEELGNNCLYDTVNINSSRGCFGNCSFCFINSYYGCTKRRERSIDSIINELETRLNRRDIKKIYFTDPTFIGLNSQSKKRVIEISKFLKSKNLSFGFETRVDTIDAKTIEILSKNGAESIFLGIESGCDNILKRMNKRVSTKDIRRAVEIIRKNNINLSVGFIMFEADSTIEDLIKNYNFLNELKLMEFHDQTINMLYHNQIVLYGSKSWSSLSKSNKLIYDNSLPFEAKYKFADLAVAKVCDSMSKISSKYFLSIDRYWKELGFRSNIQYDTCHNEVPGILNEDILNITIKEAFCSFVETSTSMNEQNYIKNEQSYLDKITKIFN